ncbi:MAG: prolyl oligopeptidase family serine peptidase [Acidobacteriota bacterium]
MRRLAFFVAFFQIALIVQADAPPTPIEPVKETLHGIELVDPYRWLEGSDAPEIEEPQPELDARVAKWTETQNAYTRSVLDNLAGRDRLRSRLHELLSVGSVSSPAVRGQRYFNRERRGDESQTSLFVREGLDGTPRRLIDPNRLADDGLTALAWSEASHDGELLAFGLYRGGDENATLHLMRVDDGEWLADEIPSRVGGVFWMPDGSSFIYRCLADAENPYSAQIKFHRVGRHHRHDPVLFEQYKEGPLATTWGPFPGVDPAGRWLVINYFTGTESNDLWLYDLAHWRETGKLRRTDIVLGEIATTMPIFAGDELLLLTTLEAPNGRIVAVDLDRPGPDHWRELVPEHEAAVIRDVSVAAERLAVSYLEKAATRIELFDFTGASRGDLELPGIGSASLRTEPGRSEAFLRFESFNEPRSIYRVDLATGDRSLWARPDVPVDPDEIVVEQVFYPSKDGTEVPMFIAHRKGLQRNGKNPTMLSGYGGFSVSPTPQFSARNISWMEAGGVYALANLRGGGEYGKAWHRAGMLENKQNVFDDFIAAAEWLIAQGFTNSEQLGILGGSNGGLLTGAALVQRPDLFSAVFSGVPLLDMLRYQHFLMARYWVPEYGTAEKDEHLPFLLRYSPYQNVEQGTKYPAVLLTAGENDTRVHPLHARKMAARLQAATANDTDKEPILLWVEGDVGHGGGKPLALRERDAADVLGFMAWQLGLSWPQAKTGSGTGSTSRP